MAVRCYESGEAQLSLEALNKVALGLSVTIDSLVFEEGIRGRDEELALQCQATSRFDAEERKVVKALLDSLTLKHEAKRRSTIA